MTLYAACQTFAAGITDSFLETLVGISPLYSIPLGIAFAGALLYAFVNAIRG